MFTTMIGYVHLTLSAEMLTSWIVFTSNDHCFSGIERTRTQCDDIFKGYKWMFWELRTLCFLLLGSSGIKKCLLLMWLIPHNFDIVSYRCWIRSWIMFCGRIYNNFPTCSFLGKDSLIFLLEAFSGCPKTSWSGPNAISFWLPWKNSVASQMLS